MNLQLSYSGTSAHQVGLPDKMQDAQLKLYGLFVIPPGNPTTRGSVRCKGTHMRKTWEASEKNAIEAHVSQKSVEGRGVVHEEYAILYL